jgi:hypothetical protein
MGVQVRHSRSGRDPGGGLVVGESCSLGPTAMTCGAEHAGVMSNVCVVAALRVAANSTARVRDVVAAELPSAASTRPVA